MSLKYSLDEEQSKKCSLILEAIQLHLDSQELKRRVLNCKSWLVDEWKDDNSLDFVHHCILSNNMMALVLLMNQGHFKPPYEPATWPYLHLVACLGHRTLIPIAVQELKFQNDLVELNWKIYSNVIKVKIEGYSPDLKEREMVIKHTPVDIAALFGHIDCVCLLLDFWQVHNKSVSRRRYAPSKSADRTSASTYLSLACQTNSPNAVRLLILEKSVNNEELKEALESAVRTGIPECVDVILREGGFTNVKSTFQGMNLFHVLYSYRSCRNKKQYEEMVEMTTVLLRHNQDVNACKPSRTFPLHSLLSHEPVGCCIEDSSPCIIASLLALLSSGADPNLDEIFIEDKLQLKEENTAYGRRPYSSALNCFLCTLPAIRGPHHFDSSKDPLEQHAYKCIEILLRHGADMSYFGQFNERSFYDNTLEENLYHEGTPLHVLLSTRPIAFFSYPLLRLVLRYGADADARGKWFPPQMDSFVQFAINILPISIWTATSNATQTSDLKVFSEKDLKSFRYIMRFMDKNATSLAYKEFTNLSANLRNSIENGSHESKSFNIDMYEKICSEYEQELKKPWCLQKCCSSTIWRSCRMHMGNIFDLPIPNPLRKKILEFH